MHDGISFDKILPKYVPVGYFHGLCQGGLGYANDPFGKIFEIDRENLGFLRKRPSFQNPGDVPGFGKELTENNRGQRLSYPESHADSRIPGTC
jgi:hypothetical protein